MQCQLDTRLSATPSVLARIVPSKLHGECIILLFQSRVKLMRSIIDYAELCGEEITTQAVLRYDDDSATATNATLQSREVLQSSCLYGVPEIATSPLAILNSGRRAWPFIAVAVLMLLFLFERRHHK